MCPSDLRAGRFMQQGVGEGTHSLRVKPAAEQGDIRKVLPCMCRNGLQWPLHGSPNVPRREVDWLTGPVCPFLCVWTNMAHLLAFTWLGTGMCAKQVSPRWERKLCVGGPDDGKETLENKGFGRKKERVVTRCPLFTMC